MKPVLWLCVALVVAGCHPRAYDLRNDRTGQLTNCGGKASALVVAAYGDRIGHDVRRSDDTKCVDVYKRRGFRVVQR